MKKYFLSLFFCFPFFALAQLTDDFSDGDFINNPTWGGDASEFIVNASQQLQLNAAALGISYLSTSNNSPSLDNVTWQFYINLDFSPSSGNYARVYLVSDNSNLEGNLNGYYLQFGETGSLDAIELFKQTSTSSTSVARGTDGFISSAFTISVQVTRDNFGNWSLLADPAAGTNFILQATGNDNTYNSSSFFGVVCNYTVSNITNFYFDDFIIPYTTDVTPPSIASISVINSNQVDVAFNEPVEQSSAEDELNYSVDNSIGNPSSAICDGANTSLVHLTFTASFVSGNTNILSVLNVEDLSGNAITSTITGQFTYYAPVIPLKYDVVINEFIADPNPQVGLPDAEFIEIFNRSNKTFDLANWMISDDGSPKVLPSKILAPGDYLILCDDGDAPALSAFGNVLGLTSFPGLNDDGDILKLFDANSNIIDEVMYDMTTYHDTQKDDGGWSIERIDPDFICINALNWRASVSSIGGTPGYLNSVDGIFSDNEFPYLPKALVVDTNKVRIYFSEPMNSIMISDVSKYSIDYGIGQPISAVPQAGNLSVLLTLPSTIQFGIIYKTTVSLTMTDCAGNELSGNDFIRFAIPDVADIMDIIINEILFNPFENGFDFVEIYNRSEKPIDLKNIRIANIDPDSNKLDVISVITDEGYVIFPGDYVALTENPDIVKNQYQTKNPAAIITVKKMPAYNTDKGGAAIATASLNIFDQFNYSEDFHYPLLNDNKGVSLERISFSRATQDSTNWHSAAETAGFATPAYENSQHAEIIDDGSEVIVEPEIFSPDNDSHDDVVNIHYNFDEPGYTANVKIFDSKGREKIHLVKNQLLGLEGTFSWDGITDENEKASVGIYVIYLEAFNTSGKVKKIKKSFVLASKL